MTRRRHRHTAQSETATEATSPIQDEDEAAASNEDRPLYVNPKQYERIIKRRQARAKLEIEGRIPRHREKFMHRSRHEHALKRVRGEGGRFAPGPRKFEDKASTVVVKSDGRRRHHHNRNHHIDPIVVTHQKSKYGHKKLQSKSNLNDSIFPKPTSSFSKQMKRFQHKQKRSMGTETISSALTEGQDQEIPNGNIQVFKKKQTTSAMVIPVQPNEMTCYQEPMDMNGNIVQLIHADPSSSSTSSNAQCSNDRQAHLLHHQQSLPVMHHDPNFPHKIRFTSSHQDGVNSALRRVRMPTEAIRLPFGYVISQNHLPSINRSVIPSNGNSLTGYHPQQPVTLFVPQTAQHMPPTQANTNNINSTDASYIVKTEQMSTSMAPSYLSDLPMSCSKQQQQSKRFDSFQDGKSNLRKMNASHYMPDYNPSSIPYAALFANVMPQRFPQANRLVCTKQEPVYDSANVIVASGISSNTVSALSTAKSDASNDRSHALSKMTGCSATKKG